MKNIEQAILELIKQTSCMLPVDVQQAIKTGYENEAKNSPAKNALHDIIENVKIAQNNSTPLCQDTGTNYFLVEYPYNYDTGEIVESIKNAVIKATKLNYLRPNSVDPVTGINTGNNTGTGHPAVDLVPSHTDNVKIKLMLKGGGCENMGVQYSLPDENLKAGRDLKGIKTCILDAVHKAQGFGCAPGIIGVCIGGDRAGSMKHAKKQFFRKLGSPNPDKLLYDIEREMLEKANELNIGPMGYGGKTTVLGVFISKLNRIPASFFLSVSYMCWACRRKTMTLYPDGRFEIE